MLWVKIGTHIVDHQRLLEAGIAARDLWMWGMLYAGSHETDGELPMVAVLSSAWGAGMKANIKQAAKLVDVGLWERTDTGFRILRWAEQGNQTKAQIDAERAAARSRKRLRGSPELFPNDGRTNAKVPTSTSLSTSESPDLGSEIASPPDWWEGTCDLIDQNHGVTLNRGGAWLGYIGHRTDKGRGVNRADALSWLTRVEIPALRKEREDRRHREQRDKDFDAARRERKVDYTPKHEQPTREQSKAMVAALAACVQQRKAAGT